MEDRRSPLGKAKGAGSAKSGHHHWMLMKLTSLALIPLFLWLAYIMVNMSSMTWDEQRILLSEPLNSFLMLVFIVMASYHGANGFQTIIEDYVHTHFLKFISIYLFKAVTYLAGLAAALSILFLFFNG